MGKYPKVYFQMRKILELCRANRRKVKDQDYLNALIAELEIRCIAIECENIDDLPDADEEMTDFDLNISSEEIAEIEEQEMREEEVA